MIFCPYQDSTWDTQSNIALRLLVLSQATPSGTPSGGGLYLSVYPLFRPHMDTVFNRPGVAGAVL